MSEVTVWTGREIRALRQAMRLTISDFAEHLDVAERTVAYWESPGSSRRPRQFQQSLLDTVLSRLDESAQGRFDALLMPEVAALRQPSTEPAGDQGRGAWLGDA